MKIIFILWREFIQNYFAIYKNTTKKLLPYYDVNCDEPKLEKNWPALYSNKTCTIYTNYIPVFFTILRLVFKKEDISNIFYDNHYYNTIWIKVP